MWHIIAESSKSFGCLDNNALNRSVQTARVGQLSDGRDLPLYPTTVFTTSTLFDASVNAGVIQTEEALPRNPYSSPSSTPDASPWADPARAPRRAEIVSCVGVFGFCLSLLLPAIKHGQVHTGLTCFFMAFIAFVTESHGGASQERQLMCIAAHLMHLLAIVSLVQLWLGRRSTKPIQFLLSVVIVAIAAYLFTVPYSSIEAIYPGYYVWLLSVCTISLAHFVPNNMNSGR